MGLLAVVGRSTGIIGPSSSSARRWIQISAAVCASSARAATLDTLLAKPDTAQRVAGYTDTPRDELVRRVVALELALEGAEDKIKSRLEGQLRRERRIALKGLPRPSAKPLRPYNVLAQPCRKIALRFSYDGEPYLGLTTQAGTDTLLPTPFEVADTSVMTPEQLGPGTNSVEAVLWHALAQLRLVDPQYGFDGVEFTRCGRTDRGVSAASQVVSLWVRSKAVDEWEARQTVRRQNWNPSLGESAKTDPILTRQPALDEDGQIMQFTPGQEELPYVQALNNVLPSTIRITGWSPVRPTFSARFDCRYRHYKYFFTEGAPSALRTVHGSRALPGLHNAGERLNIAAMREAAAKFLGEHDFRNFCRILPVKQVKNFRREVHAISVDAVQPGWPLRPPLDRDPAWDPSFPAYPADIDRDSGSAAFGQVQGERMFVLNLRGSAFLYHQVRHMVAVLFMVGVGMEEPSVVDELLNVERGAVAADRLSMRMVQLRIGPDAPHDHQDRISVPASSARSMLGGVVADDAFEGLAERQAAAQQAVHSLREAVLRDRGSAVLMGAPEWDDGGDGVRMQPSLDQLYGRLPVLNGRPAYMMARGEPLMLWDCGFRASDVQWRTGTYDGPFTLPAAGAGPDPSPDSDRGQEADTLAVAREARRRQCPNSAAHALTNYAHAEWVRATIKAEMYRHFVLASPTPCSGGWLAASTLYHHARHPALVPPPPLKEYGLPSATREAGAGAGAAQGSDHPVERKQHLPLGNGTSTGGLKTKLSLFPRDDPPEVKNERFLQEKGWKLARRRRVVQDKYGQRSKSRAVATEESQAEALEEEEE